MAAWLKKLGLVLSARCEQTSRIASDACDGPVAPHARLAARLHEAVCPGCRRFRRQLGWIERTLAAAPPEARQELLADSPPDRLSADAATRIESALSAARVADNA